MLIRRGWLVWPLAGAAACLIYVVLPLGWDYAWSAVTGAVAVVLLAVSVRRKGGGFRPGWWIFSAGVLAWACGDAISTGNLLTLGFAPYPSWADVCYLAGYPLLAGGLYILTRRLFGGDAGRLLDTAVIATGATLVYWITVLGPVFADASMSPLVRLTTAGYLTSGVLLFAIVAPLVVRVGQRSPSLWLLTVGSGVCLVGVVVYSLFPTANPLVVQFTLGGFPFAYLCFAGVAMHPSSEDLDAPCPELPPGSQMPGKGRLVLLGASMLVVPVALVIQGWLLPRRVDWLAIAIGSIILVLLVLTRLSGFVTLVHRQTQELSEAALRDDLTGLPNRRRLEQRLSQAVPTGSAHVAILDLNGFKEVNDHFGHAVGDRLLVEVGLRLRASLRPGDLVARMGGDEFAILLTDAHPAAMEALVARLTTALHRPISISRRELLVTASFGSARNDDTDDPYEVLRRADVAMYAAKRAASGSYRAYTPEMDRLANEQSQIAAELRVAAEAGQFHLVYQPIVALPEGRTVAVEALLRWTHPERGPVSPAMFIPVAEQTGTIIELGAWVLRTACAQAVAWRAALGALAPARVSVNVSPRQLAEPGFTALVASVLANTGLPARGLVVEVTETAVFGGVQTVQTVQALHELGVQIALDDFGTGHSSLGLLQTVPVDILKVDKSFVDHITLAGRHAVIANALIQVSSGLGLTAVAEGVETAEQADELYRLGYRLAQGYHFGKPALDPILGYVDDVSGSRQHASGAAAAGGGGRPG